MTYVVHTYTDENGTVWRLHDSGELTYTHGEGTRHAEGEKLYEGAVRYFVLDAYCDNPIKHKVSRAVYMAQVGVPLCGDDGMDNVAVERHTVFANGVKQVCFTYTSL